MARLLRHVLNAGTRVQLPGSILERRNRERLAADAPLTLRQLDRLLFRVVPNPPNTRLKLAARVD